MSLSLLNVDEEDIGESADDAAQLASIMSWMDPRRPPLAAGVKESGDLASLILIIEKVLLNPVVALLLEQTAATLLQSFLSSLGTKESDVSTSQLEALKSLSMRIALLEARLNDLEARSNCYHG